MEDLFSETLIKKKRTAKDLAAWLPLFCLGVLLLIGGLLVHPLLLLAGAAAAGLGIWLQRRHNIEYEYAYVNGQLDIDCIYARTSRRRLASYDLRQMEVMAPLGSEFLARSGGGNLRTADYTSGEEAERDRVYAVILPHEGATVRVLFQPTEAMKKDIRMRAPSKVHL